MSDSNTNGAGIGKLAAALAKARVDFTPIEKGRTAKIDSPKGSYSYSYADLSDVLAAVIPALSKHELIVSQTTALSNGGLVLLTRLVHASGEQIMGEYPLPVGVRAQEAGSAMTYARRYTLCALLAIAAEDDDDGAAANKAAPVQVERKKPGPKPRPGDDVTAMYITEGQRKLMFQVAKEQGISPDALKGIIKDMFGVESSGDIPGDGFERLIHKLEGRLEGDVVTQEII